MNQAVEAALRTLMREGDWEPICGGERTKEVW